MNETAQTSFAPTGKTESFLGRTRDELIRDLRELAAQNGGKVTRDLVRNNSNIPEYSYKHFFGSWKGFVQAADIDGSNVRRLYGELDAEAAYYMELVRNHLEVGQVIKDRITALPVWSPKPDEAKYPHLAAVVESWTTER